MNKILATQIKDRGASARSKRDQFFLSSIHLTSKLRELDYKKSQSDKKTEKENGVNCAIGRSLIYQNLRLKTARLDAMDLNDKIASLASHTAEEAFRDPEITVELMGDLLAWGEFIRKGKQSWRYGLKVFVGMELGIFLSRNKRFPKRSELQEALRNSGFIVSGSSMQDHLGYYDAPLEVVRDNQKG